MLPVLYVAVASWDARSRNHAVVRYTLVSLSPSVEMVGLWWAPGEGDWSWWVLFVYWVVVYHGTSSVQHAGRYVVHRAEFLSSSFGLLTESRQSLK